MGEHQAVTEIAQRCGIWNEVDRWEDCCSCWNRSCGFGFTEDGQLAITEPSAKKKKKKELDVTIGYNVSGNWLRKIIDPGKHQETSQLPGL